MKKIVFAIAALVLIATNANAQFRSCPNGNCGQPQWAIPSGNCPGGVCNPPRFNSTANISIQLPVADAQIVIDGNKTTSQGVSRTFQSPPLQNGTYYYEVTSIWTHQGRTITQTKKVAVQPGTTTQISFTPDTVLVTDN